MASENEGVRRSKRKRGQVPDAGEEETEKAPRGSSALSKMRHDEKEAKEKQEGLYLITMGEYSILPSAPEKSRLLELQEFLVVLDGMAKNANPGTDYDRWYYGMRARRSQKRGEDDGWTELQEKLEKMSPDIDLTIVTTVDEMREQMAAKTTWTKPILIPADCEYGRQLADSSSTGPQDIPAFLARLDVKRKVSVQDLGLKETAKSDHVRPLSKSVAAVKKHFLQPSGTDTVWNCLDIAVPNAGAIYTPLEIMNEDLYHQSANPEGSAGRGGQPVWNKDLARWFLLSDGGAISSIHMDAGGPCTWIRPLVGRKIWYFGRGVTNLSEDDKNRFLEHEHGDLSPEGYMHGWSRIELKPGDTL